MTSDSLSNNNLFQNSLYVGNVLQDILYGVVLVLYFETMQILVTRSRSARRKSDVFYALFSTIMVFCVTVWVATGAIFGQEMWVLHSDYPGGYNAYWENHIADWYMDWGTTTIIILQLMTDALMIYRCHIIWNSYRIIILPVVLWLGTLVLGILVDWTSSSPGGNFFSGVAAQIGLSYYSVSVVLNTTLTCMICYRLVRHAKRIQKGLGSEYASPYFTVVSIVVESVIPYTLSGIASVVSLGIGSPTSVTFISVYFLMMCISPQMLILRVMMGRAWDKDSSSLQDSTLKFSPGGISGSRWFESSGTAPRVHLQTLSNASVQDGRERKASITPV